jgi:hypothetical protein
MCSWWERRFAWFFLALPPLLEWRRGWFRNSTASMGIAMGSGCGGGGGGSGMGHMCIVMAQSG